MIRATYEVEPAGAAETLAVRASIGMEKDRAGRADKSSMNATVGP